MKIAIRNIANAARDNDYGYQLLKRIYDLIGMMLTINADIFVFIEAGRPTFNDLGEEVTWDQVSEIISSKSGYVHGGVIRNNDTKMAFGISFFRKEDVQITSYERVVICEDGYKTVALYLEFLKGNETKKLLAIHLSPPSAEQRMTATLNLIRIAKERNVDFIAGDFNTYADLDGPKLIEEYEKYFTNYTKQLMSFVSFPHDLVDYNEKFMFSQKINGGKCRVGSSLDHVFSDKIIEAYMLNPIDYTPLKEEQQADVFNRIINGEQTGSDHFPYVVNL